MANSIRETIIAKFVTNGANILTTGGYNTSMGSKVYRAAGEIDESFCPCLNVIPGPETAEQQYETDRMHMMVQIEGFVKHGSSNTSTIAEQILADLRKCFTMKQRTIPGAGWGNAVEAIYYRGGGLDTYAKAGESITGFMIRVEVTYTTAMGDPYN